MEYFDSERCAKGRRDGREALDEHERQRARVACLSIVELRFTTQPARSEHKLQHQGLLLSLFSTSLERLFRCHGTTHVWTLRGVMWVLLFARETHRWLLEVYQIASVLATIIWAEESVRNDTDQRE